MNVLNKISDIRDGDAFPHYKSKFYLQQGAETIDDERMRKLYVNHGVLNMLIELFTSFCPDLFLPATKGKSASKKIELLKATLTAIKWNDLNSQIYDLLEAKGDVFFYIYFEKDKSKGKNKKQFILPKIRELDAEGMQTIILDEVNEPKAYIYTHKIYDEIIDYKTGAVTKENERNETLIFEKGKCHRIVDRIDEEGNLVVDEEGKLVVDKTTINNDDSFKDVIPLIHIASIKRQEEKFSVIPAEKYIDLCLTIDQIHSDIRATNRNLGFPKHMLLDCKITKGDGKIGGFIELESAKPTEETGEASSQGKVIDSQIKNGLDSVYTELQHTIDMVYDIVGITNPTLMKRVSSSDSSKMYNQVNMRMEQKIEGYIDNILEGFKPFFKIVLGINGLYNEKEDYGYSFVKPQSIIKNSAYDELLIKQLELNTGIKTLYDQLKDKGYNDEEISSHFKKINEEIRNGKNDLRVTEKQTATATTNETGGIS